MVKIRLRRMGARNRPFYRVVVANSRKAASAAGSIEEIGYYDPIKQPAEVKIDKERVSYWVSKGAQLSDTVKSLLPRA